MSPEQWKDLKPGQIVKACYTGNKFEIVELAKGKKGSQVKWVAKPLTNTTIDNPHVYEVVQ